MQKIGSNSEKGVLFWQEFWDCLSLPESYNGRIIRSVSRDEPPFLLVSPFRNGSYKWLKNRSDGSCNKIALVSVISCR